MGGRDATVPLLTTNMGNRRLGVQLVRDALVVRRTARTNDQVGVIGLRLDQFAYYLLIAPWADIDNRFTTAGTNQEKDVQHPGTLVPAKSDHSGQFVGIPLSHRKMDLEKKIVVAAGFGKICEDHYLY